MKVLLISIEFIDPIFSGNGIAARSLARALLCCDGVSIFIVCGRPGNLMEESRPLERCDFVQCLQVSDDSVLPMSGISIPLPVWYRTDIRSSYSEFSQAACSCAEIELFDPDLSIVIDWTGSMAHRALVKAERVKAPSIFFAFCCYTYLSGVTSLEQEFYREQEELALKSSVLTIAICSGDEKKLRKIYMPCNVKVLPPPLRIDIQNLTSGCAPVARRYVTCCLRLHPSKNVEVFVEAIKLMQEFLVERSLVPVLCGSAADMEYAESCRGRLRAVFPSSEIYEEFLNAESMVTIFRSTILNIHTALYEPYGMTIVEAAAAGAPTIVHKDWTEIGATELLDPGQGACLLADMCSARDLAAAIRVAVSEGGANLDTVGETAQRLALGWGEAAYAVELGRILVPYMAC